MVTDLPPVLSHDLQSSTPPADTETWATVVRKNNPQRKTQPKAQVASSAIQKKGRTIVLPKVPTTAVIAITIPEGSSATYAEVMFEARQHIQLSQFGIESLKQRIEMTGGMLLEISGADCNAKADKLATRMQEVLADIDVRITRPCKMGEIIILDVDESVSPVDVAIAVAEAGGCSPDDVKVGAIRRQLHSLGRVWVRCPLATVKKLSSSKKIRIGWASMRVQFLEPRPLQCFRCLEFGHVRRQCSGTVDRSDQCYACAGRGHKANECTVETYRCPICADLGHQSDHRMGTQKCFLSKEKGQTVVL
ncbi:hypothetical protein HF086_009855 [Spodoptera exigua]|uniref:CCHC-type domain-containing protein n=1 Tax=Spodoptera exigua TaxID=7107 RepID=A0A922M413_SPOEX|nr:hypothetical protein HF086_009855 [Spodoptera exigua]